MMSFLSFLFLWCLMTSMGRNMRLDPVREHHMMVVSLVLCLFSSVLANLMVGG